MKPTILVVEDDLKIATLVAKNLEAAGYACHQAHDGERALEAFERLKPALVVLDLMLPGLDGLAVTRQIRRQGDTLILMLTARSSESDRLLGFELGADDYMVKPFSTLELVARVRALLRRSPSGTREEPLTRGALRIDPARRVVERSGERVELTTLEFDLLLFLASRPGRVYSRESLMDHVWGDGRIVDERSIDSLISRLRRKLEPDAAKPRYVQTVWGAGYRFAEGEE
jgi:DNA-binding response OmpR family regulator